MEQLESLYRVESAKLMAAVTRLLGSANLGLVENVVHDTFVAALEHWRTAGVPENAAAWLMTTAKHRAIDWLRRDRRGIERPSLEPTLALDVSLSESTEPQRRVKEHLRHEPADDQLCMMFVTCHPELPLESQLVLTLHTLCGLTNQELSRALLVETVALEKRLVRARKRLREIHPPFELPETAQLRERLDSVLLVLYLLFSEGYSSHSGSELIRHELCFEAIRLTELLLVCELTDQPRVHALLALLYLQASRLDARFDRDGNLLSMAEQDRSRWDKKLIVQGLKQLELSAEGENLSTYHLEAGIAGCHALAPSFEATDWRRIIGYYDQLLDLNPSPVIALNRAIALAMAGQTQQGLNEVERLHAEGRLKKYAPLCAATAEMFTQLGRLESARRAYREALTLAESEHERRFLERRLSEIA